MGLFGKKKPEPTIKNEDMIDSSKCNFLLSNGICGITTYGIIRRCAKDKCIFMQMLTEKRKNTDYMPEEQDKENDLPDEQAIREFREWQKKAREQVEQEFDKEDVSPEEKPIQIPAKNPLKKTITYNPDGSVDEEYSD